VRGGKSDPLEQRRGLQEKRKKKILKGAKKPWEKEAITKFSSRGKKKGNLHKRSEKGKKKDQGGAISREPTGANADGNENPEGKKSCGQETEPGSKRLSEGHVCYRKKNVDKRGQRKNNKNKRTRKRGLGAIDVPEKCFFQRKKKSVKSDWGKTKGMEPWTGVGTHGETQGVICWRL